MPEAKKKERTKTISKKSRLRFEKDRKQNSMTEIMVVFCTYSHEDQFILLL